MFHCQSDCVSLGACLFPSEKIVVMIIFLLQICPSKKKFISNIMSKNFILCFSVSIVVDKNLEHNLCVLNKGTMYSNCDYLLLTLTNKVEVVRSTT